MSLKVKIFKALLHPTLIITHLNKYHIYKWMPDAMFLKFTYRLKMGTKLNLDKPKTFNEKIQWLKLYDRRPEYKIMADKYAVKDYIAKKLGEEYLVPVIGVWSSPDEINFDLLPDKFVLKCTHNSGLGMCICKDKSTLKIKKVKKKLAKGLRQDYFINGREWSYKDITRRIIGEQFLGDENGIEPNDYKIICSEGKFICSFVCTERYKGTGLKVTFFDGEWNRLPFERHYPSSEKKIKKPENYSKMIDFAKLLSKDIPLLRVDFYEVNGRLYFGEITLYPGSGFEEFTPSYWDKKLGDMITIPKNKIMEK